VTTSSNLYCRLPTRDSGCTSQESEEPQISSCLFGHETRHPDTQKKNVGKLRPNWEKPYTVVARGGKGSYNLADKNEKTIDNQWSSFRLKWYYV